MVAIAALAAFAAPAFSQSIDNPLFSPEKGSFYVKAEAGFRLSAKF
jgi:hypothetical protein